MHVKGCTRNPMGRGVHRRGGTSTGVGGKNCEVIIFTERLDREIMHPTTLAHIDHCTPKVTKMTRLIITESIANLPSVKNTMIKI